MAFFRNGILGLGALLLAGCAQSSQMGNAEATIPDTDAFVSGTGLHRQDEQNQVFRVSGCVRHPGKFSLRPGGTMTLSEALRLAGGTAPGTTFDNGASLNDVRVSRLKNGSLVVLKLDVRPGHDGGSFAIQSGDEIFVPEVIF